MNRGFYPAPIELDADPAALTTRARTNAKRGPVFASMVEDFGELRTVERDRQPVRPAAPLPAPDAREAVLRLTSPGQRLQQIRLCAGQTLVIGRSGVSDLKLRDAALSRTHLKVGFGADGVDATDLGSTNGSYLRGKAFINASLKVGDQVVFGLSVLEVVRISTSVRAAA